MTDSVVVVCGPPGKRNRCLYQLLDAHYDEAAARYRQGWSDERVARECQLGPNYIAAVREEVYGPLRPDPELAALEAAVADLLDTDVPVAKVAALRSCVEALKRRRGLPLHDQRQVLSS